MLEMLVLVIMAGAAVLLVIAGQALKDILDAWADAGPGGDDDDV